MENMKKLLFIYNPKAGKGQIKTWLLDIIDIFTKAGYTVTARPTQYAGEAVELAANRTAKYDLVVCSGGDGTLDEVCSPLPLDKKFEAFNFHVINVEDGNDMAQLRAAFDEAKTVKGMPTAIIARTVKGKGVSFMEGQVGWHGKAPNDEEYKIAMADLERIGEALCQK